VELAGNLYVTDSSCEIGTVGLLNIMKAFNMVAGKPQPQEGQKLTGKLRYAGRLRASRGGIMYIRKRPGEKIMQGETVIEIVDVYGDVVEEIKMPITGYCWSFTGGIGRTHAITEGDNLAYTFEELGIDKG
jgi:predicted deacylase